MGRTELEQKLTEMGWVFSGTMGRDRIWRHPRRRDPIYVPNTQIILDSVGRDILEEAKG